MKIRSVTAHAFGPLRGETLTFAEGMTVVVGSNESAKSSWHAAIFAALCGRRRGKGKPRADEQKFIELHKPWDQSDWLVTAQITLDDGRNVEMRQDLAGKVDCHAKDLNLARDVSSEIMNDGTPDASRWLGLDRSSFVATACVEQAQMLRVRTDAEGLQDHLQRAAATAGSETTAATALDRIDAYLRDRVGRDQANSTKPLRSALLSVERARSVLAERHKTHEEYLSRVEQVEKLRGEAATAAATVRAYEAAAAAQLATELKKRTDRTQELHAKYGNTTASSVLDDDAIAQQVSGALTTWQSRPARPVLPERSSARIKEEIAALPAAPEGDLQPHPDVLTAADRLKHAIAQLELHDKSRPSVDVSSPQVAASDEELLDLARLLETPVPAVPPELAQREAAAHDALTRSKNGGQFSTMLIAAGAVVAVVGLLLLAIVGPAVGTAVALIGAGLAIGGVVQRQNASSASAGRDLAEAQGLLQAAQAQRADAAHRREQSVARCAQLHIPADPKTLRAIPVARERAVAEQRRLQQWNEQQATLRSESTTVADELANALTARGHAAGTSDTGALLAAAGCYQQACRDRTAQAAESARRRDLLEQLAAAEAAELRAADDDQTRSRAGELVIATAGRCGITSDTPEHAVAELQNWTSQRSERLAEATTKQQEWAELQALLDGRTLGELEQASQAASTRAADLTELVDPALLASLVDTSPAEKLPELRDAATRAETNAAAEDGQLRQFAMDIGSVAEAEEDLGKAEAELSRVRELKETLELTRQFLEAAQTRVHRDIAPLLSENLEEWLPAVTGGRYTNVVIDPKSLLVQVCGTSQRWRDAHLLSHGTAEQVYLLLRIALVSRLTKGHDTCPLLLDDITVHADTDRTRDILNLLLHVSADRQVVLFTQERQVIAWAREHLTDTRHRIHELTPIAVA